MAQAKRAKTTKKSVGRPKGSTNKSKGTRSRKKKNNVDKNLIVVVMIIVTIE